MFRDDANEAEGWYLPGIQKKHEQESWKSRAQSACVIMAEIVERSLHTCGFSCPIKPSSKLYLHVWLTGMGEEAGGGGVEMRGEEIVLAVIMRYLAVTALVSLNSWGLSQLLMSRCAQPNVNRHTHTQPCIRKHTLFPTCAHLWKKTKRTQTALCALICSFHSL